MGPDTENFEYNSFLERTIYAEAKNTAEEIERIGNAFVRRMLDNMEDLEPEYQKVLDDHFWELLEP